MIYVGFRFETDFAREKKHQCVASSARSDGGAVPRHCVVHGRERHRPEAVLLACESKAQASIYQEPKQKHLALRLSCAVALGNSS